MNLVANFRRVMVVLVRVEGEEGELPHMNADILARENSHGINDRRI